VRGVVPPLGLLIAIVVVGCGGGPTKTATGVETQHGKQPLSKARYIALGDVICKNQHSRTEDLESQTVDLGRLNSAGKAHQVAELLRQQSENLRVEAHELQDLQPPPADVDTAASIVSLVRAKAGLIGNWAKAYDDLDTSEIRRLQIQIGLLTAKVKSRARAHGFKVCGQE
jgi:hypothetical protein